MEGFDVLGAGHGGAQAAVALRQLNHEGSLTISLDDGSRIGFGRLIWAAGERRDPSYAPAATSREFT